MMSSTEVTASALLAWLAREGLTTAVSDDSSVIDVTIPDSGNRTLRVAVLPDNGFLSFSMRVRGQVPRARWTALYPLLAEVNATIAIGAWVLDPDTGAVLYRLALPARGAAYGEEALRSVIAHVARTVAAYDTQFQRHADDDVLASWLAEDMN